MNGKGTGRAGIGTAKVHNSDGNTEREILGDCKGRLEKSHDQLQTCREKMNQCWDKLNHTKATTEMSNCEQTVK